MGEQFDSIIEFNNMKFVLTDVNKGQAEYEADKVTLEAVGSQHWLKLWKRRFWFPKLIAAFRTDGLWKVMTEDAKETDIEKESKRGN